MPTITEDRVRSRAKRATISKSAPTILNEAARDFRSYKTYDVFLSHSTKDAELVLGIKLILEDHGRSVYVDWIEDPELDRANVKPATAETLRNRMQSCLSLVYLHSGNSGASKWMPWELGYFDGYRGAVAVLPVTKSEESSFYGQEYLGIYPWIDESALSLKDLRVHRSTTDYKSWREWTSDAQAFRKTA
ncbi:TIR domain-containing protein [Rhizobium laguerreae]|uniref:TIR domain-containing protein n=1 Tax=Rhizobium laguerreae TaxID=1076926 RepID=UPI001C914BF7|nr:TIR domain-containing protein [Rhizobium laguerreae]MBY3252159.1 TIR domain-containing protein [Rhizobium laguerreae]